MKRRNLITGFGGLWIHTAMLLVLSGSTPALAQSTEPAAEITSMPGERQGYLVNVDLPLVGERDQEVSRQILRIADTYADSEVRPIVVLRFRSAPLSSVVSELDNGSMGTRGSQFGRSQDLARFLTSRKAARVRLVAYLPRSVEGHAVLPVLACEDIYAASGAELGRAAIDEASDASIEAAYRDIAQRRATLPEAVAISMLDPAVEVVQVQLADGGTQVVTRPEAAELREAGKVLREEVVWRGGAQAMYSGRKLRARRWIARTVEDETQLTEALGLSGSLRTTRQLPRDWTPVSVTLDSTLTASLTSQIMRSLRAEISEQQLNLVVLRVQQTDCDFRQAALLAGFIADLERENIYTLSVILEPIQGPIGLVAAACQESVLLSDAQLGPDQNNSVNLTEDESYQNELGDLASRTGRPLALLSALADVEARVGEFTDQETGKRAIFANWQVSAQADQRRWVPKREIAGGESIPSEVAQRYRLVDSVDPSEAVALGRLGLEQAPPELETPWLDASIQMLLAQSWLPRLLLMLGFCALMAELGNPGIGAGGFIAACSFLGFFWIEGLNGNVEWLEILLFVAGLTALALELFVVPGFGIFGIGGLLMLFVSVVLASQTFIWPTTSAELQEVSVNLFWVACLALGGMIGLLFMHKHIERLPMLRWMTLLPDDQDDLDYRESMAHRDHLLGQDGLTTTRLNPSGKAQFGLDIVPVVGTGALIEEGVPVRVVEVRGNLVLVEKR